MVLFMMELHQRRLMFGEVVVDLVARTIQDRSGVELPLRAQSFAVLEYLVRHANRVVARDELIRAVWADQAVTDDSLVQCIHEIRRALNDPTKSLLRTIPKRGYRLLLPERQLRLGIDWRLPVAALLGVGLGLLGCMSWCQLRASFTEGMSMAEGTPRQVEASRPAVSAAVLPSTGW